MARKKGNTGTEQKVVDYRYDDEKRKNIPPAGLAAQGKIREKPKIRYAYNPHLPHTGRPITLTHKPPFF
jgi:adenine-specific DNA-methyltransferase